MIQRIIGQQAVLKILKEPKKNIHKIAIDKWASGNVIDEITAIASNKNIPFEFVDESQVSILAGSVIRKGIVALCEADPALSINEMITRIKMESRQTFILVLDELALSPELPFIIDSAVAAGVQGVVFKSRGQDTVPIETDIFISEVPSITEAVDELKNKHKLWVAGNYFASPDVYCETDLDLSLALIIGAEGQKLKPELRKLCDILIKVPLPDKGALTSSQFYAVLFFEFARQRMTWATGGKTKPGQWIQPKGS